MIQKVYPNNMKFQMKQSTYTQKHIYVSFASCGKVGLTYIMPNFKIALQSGEKLR